ncbi:MAG: type II secretion system protein [Planctomycetota bacterium]|nr:type II secretion system protein [Planctomycetota bacterium]
MPADGRAPRGFTLTELLAVLAIVLIVVAGSISVWLAMAGAVAPGQATAVVQAMLVGARDYAVSNGVMTRVVFENSLANVENVENGTTMYLEYDTNPNPMTVLWSRVPRRGSLNAGRQVFVLTGAPDLPSAPSVAADATKPDPSVVADWQTYRDTVAKKVAQHAFTNVNAAGYLETDADFKSTQAKFYVTFDAAGTLSVDPATPLLLTIVQVAGAGRRVGEYQFYLLNANTGTQLVFE